MQLLLGSGGFRTPQRIASLSEQMRRLFGSIEEVLFIPYALRDHDGYVAMMTERGLNAEYRLKGIHRCEDPATAIMEAKGVFVGGGNSFRLLKEMQDRGLLSLLRAKVKSGLPYAGVSAGANLACPTIRTTNDMPIVWPGSLEALNLVPFQINPHYFSGHSFVKEEAGYVEHFGETRDERLSQFHEENETPVVGLSEGGILTVKETEVTLHASGARIFRKGEPSLDVTAGMRLDTFLTRPNVSYTVGATFTDPTVADEWLRWLRGGHIAEVVAGGACSADIIELEPGKSYEVRYRFPSREVFAIYERDHAPRLRAEAGQLFPPSRGVTYRRSLGDMMNWCG